MREILFRGKRRDTGEWVYGSLQVFKGYSIFDHDIYKKFFTVIGNTVGQFTGLLDKNGRKLFEGDILAYRLADSDHETIDGVVKYGKMNCSCCDGVYGWYIEGGDIRALDMDYNFDDDERLYVAGNIFDNPELLEDR